MCARQVNNAVASLHKVQKNDHVDVSCKGKQLSCACLLWRKIMFLVASRCTAAHAWCLRTKNCDFYFIHKEKTPLFASLVEIKTTLIYLPCVRKSVLMYRWQGLGNNLLHVKVNHCSFVFFFNELVMVLSHSVQGLFWLTKTPLVHNFLCCTRIRQTLILCLV